MRLQLAFLLLCAGWTASAQTCVFSLNPTGANFTAAGGNDTVAITQVSGAATCTRTATSAVSWITISFGTPGTGSGTVGYTVQANPFTVDRTGTMTIAGQTFTVTQAAGSCTLSFSPSSASVPAAGSSGSFNLSANPNSCPWTLTSSSPDWLSLTSATSGTGGGTVRYTAAPNPSTASRTATISTGSVNFTVTQAGQCAFTLNPATANVAATGGTGSIAVQASAGTCAWTASSNNPDWLTLTGNMAGNGNGTVTWAAAANTTLQDRAGSISIGGAGFNVFQPASSCTFSLSNGSAAYPASGGSGSFIVTSSCPWTPTPNVDWITITSPPSTTGSGTVTYLVAGNTSTLPRTGSIAIGNAAFTITQPGVACSVTLGTASANVPASGASGNITVQAGDGCQWVASTTAQWVTLSGASGAGTGDVLYAAAPNNTAQARQAAITIANQRFLLSQDAAQCDFQLAPAQSTIPAAGGSGSVTVQSACVWSATTSAGWITFPSGAGPNASGALSYAVSANPSSDPRTGSIRIGSASFTIVQTGRSCDFAVTPNTLAISGRGGKASAQVIGSKGCKWQPALDQDWLSIDSWSSIDGTGSVTISAPRNFSPQARGATLSAGGQAIAVVQGGLEVVVDSAASVLNAASFSGGPVAPGEIITVFGAGLGPAKAATLALAADGQHITNSLASVQVLFDGVPAPLIFVSDQQLSAQVPYFLAGKPATEMKVVNQGVESAPVTIPVALSAPAVFTLDASGKGQAAVLNQDGTVNGPANPAARNSIVQIFATGEGQTQPGGEDGRIAVGSTLPKPIQPVTATVGGQAVAQPVYAGAAPGAIAGLFQVNVRIPANAPTGTAIPLVLRVGNVSSPAGVTIAVR